ncbi:hypothetical protein AB0L97_32800 [Nocardia sp. NPDC051911]|uniref:hypothetical protein n=1 Tax=Nocardia sp. NPDC051911 TaxID=3154648 RepID=UPI003443E6B0
MTDNRIAALKALGYIPAAYDDARSTALASAATAHALLAIEARLGELVEQQRLANVIAVGNPYESQLVESEDERATVSYVRGRIGDIVNPNGRT